MAVNTDAMEPSKGMKLARKIMEGLGWKEGSGLGVKENGITEALKPAAKFDVSGLGHKGFNDFQWWDHAFNRAAKAFDVKVADDKVVVEKKEVDGSTGRIKTKKDVIVESGNLAYGTFCKTGTLSNGVIENVKEHTTVKEEKDYSLKLSDEELFRMCDGLTAHKGARHGLTAAGKLARIAKQEAMMLASLSGATADSEKPKKEKKKHQTPTTGNQELDVIQGPKSELEEDVKTCEDDSYVPEKKKKKKKKKDGDYDHPSYPTDEQEEVDFQDNTRQKKKSKSQLDDISETVRDDDQVPEKKKKRRKDRTNEDFNTSANDETQNESEACTEPKKKRKKKKHAATKD